MQLIRGDKFIAIYNDSAFNGVGILEVIEGEYVVAQAFTDNKRSQKTVNKIRYNKDGVPYFVKYDRKYWLSEFLNV
jgi:hypothetical protein